MTDNILASDALPSRSRSLLPRWALLLGLLAVLAGGGLRVYWVYLLPFNDSPDEFCHYAMVRLLRTEWRVPTMEDVPAKVPVSYPALPPVGYFPCAAAFVCVDPLLPDSYRVARLGNVFVGMLTLVIGFWAAAATFPHAPHIAVACVWGLALHPQLVFLNASVNNDSTMVLGCTTLWLMWILIARTELTFAMALFAGVIAGLTVMTKTNSAGVLLAGSPVFALQCLRGRWLAALLFVATSIATCVPWMLWSDYHHGQWWGVEIHRQWWFAHLAKQRIEQGFLEWDTFGEFALATWITFVAVFGYCSTLLDDWQYHLITLVAGIALAPLLSRGNLLPISMNLPSRSRTIAFWLAIASGLVLTFAAHIYHSAQFGMSAQGRYAFPIVWVFWLLIASGFGLFWTGKQTRHLGTGLMIALLVWLQAACIDVEKKSNRIRQPDRRVRCRLLTFSGGVPGEGGSIASQQVQADHSEIEWDNGIAIWRGNPKDHAAELEFEPTIDLQAVDYVAFEIRPTSGFSNNFFFILQRPDGTELSIPFSPISKGVCQYRFDLRKWKTPEWGQQLRFFLRAYGEEPFELHLRRWQIIDE